MHSCLGEAVKIFKRSDLWTLLWSDTGSIACNSVKTHCSAVITLQTSIGLTCGCYLNNICLLPDVQYAHAWQEQFKIPEASENINLVSWRV